VREVLTKDLEHTGIVYIGREETRNGMFSRVVHLVKDAGIRRLRPNAVAIAARAQSAAA
jgi:hypothetical protein